MQILRTSFVALLAPFLAGTANADNAEVFLCRQTKDAMQRLACYDAIDLGASSTGSTAEVAKGNNFGRAPALREPEVDFVETALLNDVDGWRPNEVFQLANGQTWQVSDGSSSVMRPKKQNVKIRRGAFGAFYIEFDGVNQSPRVKRID